MARFEIGHGVTYLDRDAWGADPALPRLGFFVPREERTQVVVHHTVITAPVEPRNLWGSEEEVAAKMRALQSIRPDLGLDVPYSFVIHLMQGEEPRIVVCEGRGEDRTGAHTKGHNTKAIGIAFQGNFEDDTDVAPFADSISAFLGWLKFDPNGPDYGGPYAPMSNLGSLSASGERAVFLHRDFKATLCPGRAVVKVAAGFGFAGA